MTRVAAVKHPSHAAHVSAPAFSAGKGDAAKLGNLKAHEMKLAPAAKKLSDQLSNLAETGDGNGAWGYLVDGKALAAAKGSAIKSILQQSLTGYDPGEDGLAGFVAKPLSRADVFSAIKKNHESDQPGVADPKQREAREAVIRQLLPSLMDGEKTKLFQLEQHDVGSGYYKGVAAVDVQRGEIRLVGISWAP